MSTKTASESKTQSAGTQKMNGALGTNQKSTLPEKPANASTVADAPDKEGKELIPVKKKMNVGEKIDAMRKLERLTKKLGHLQKSKEDLEIFASGPEGLDGAKLMLVDADENEVPIVNSEVVKELLVVAKMHVQQGIVLTEKDIEAFEIM